MYLTRNQAGGNASGVRIPPSPPRSKQIRALAARFLFLSTNLSTNRHCHWIVLLGFAARAAHERQKMGP
jgi:hypothetical protein